MDRERMRNVRKKNYNSGLAFEHKQIICLSCGSVATSKVLELGYSGMDWGLLLKDAL